MKKLLAVSGMVLTLSVAAIANATTVSVPADPLWTDTGMVLQGEKICISAEGSWTWGTSTWFGPDGDYQPTLAWDEWVQNGYHGQLVAFVGANPYAGVVNVDFYPIGSNGSLSGLSGQLWLGFNDDQSSNAVGDNAGSVRATIKTCVPEGGSALALMGLALGAVGFVSRRFRK
jgi:hypothetical protein